MALETSINVCIKDACTTIVFTETTGAYDVTTNPTGYGAPNKDTTDIVSAVLKVISPDDTEYNIDLFTESFPTSNTEFEYEIPLSSLGDRTYIEDGYWQFIYTIADDDETEYIASKTAIFTCNTACCVNSLLLNVEVLEVETKENIKNREKYNKAKAFLESLQHYAYCGNLDKFTNIKFIIDRLCSNSGCNTCD